MKSDNTETCENRERTANQKTSKSLALGQIQFLMKAEEKDL